MANSVDFRANQVQTNKIIVTGSTPQKTLLIYGIAADGSPVNNGNINQTVFPSNTIVGSDAFLFVSGAVNSRLSPTPSIAVFGGDVVISGTFYQGQVSLLKGGDYSHAQGFGTWAFGNYSHTEGTNTLTTIEGTFSHAEGYHTTASVVACHAEGHYTTASGSYSHAEGDYTVTSGSYSHAEGSFTIAKGIASHAEGEGTLAQGGFSHAEGADTLAQGDYSHAEGYECVAFGTASHAGGYGTIASGSVDGTFSLAQTVFGTFNQKNNTTSLFVVGSGSSDSDRGDMFRVNPQTVVLSGGVVHKINLRKTDYTVLPTDRFVFISVTGTDRTATLPAGSSVQIGHTVTIRKVDANLGVPSKLTISASSGEKISGKDSIQTDFVEIDKPIPSGSVTLVYGGDKFNLNFDINFSDKATWFITEYSTNTW